MFSKRAFSMATLLTVILAFSTYTQAQAGPPPQPQHEHAKSNATSQEHYDEVNQHGDMAMGFSHRKTTHHFGLTEAGGFIQVQANDAEDTASREQIRMHLQHITQAFKQGDFSLPEMTHGRVPPGVPVMQRLKGAISYQYAETKNGGKVLISTADPEALKAVHEFLRFQIEDHRTGDSLKVRK